MNKVKIKQIKPLTALLFTMALTACGGGSEEVADTPIIDTTDEQIASGTPNSSTDTTTIDDEFSLWLTDLADNHILPSYQNLADTSSTLNLQAQSFCASALKVETDITTMQQSWRDVVADWQTIQWLKVGPVFDDNRIFRIHYWPDSKDTVASGLNNLLLASEAITETYISTRSVGSQGLPVLEQLLFAQSSNDLINAEDKSKRCEILTAVSANVATIAQEINSEWQIEQGNYYQQLTQGIGDFTSQKDAVEELVTNWNEQLEIIKDDKMLIPLASEAPGFPNELEHGFSQNSVASIQQNIATFKVIFSAADGHGFDDILNDHLGQQNIATEMSLAIEAAITQANLLSGDGAELLNTAAGRAQITLTIDALRAVRDLLTVDFVQATDINIGFNANDGD